MVRFARSLVLCVAALAFAPLASAGELPVPKGEIVLSIGGKIDNHNGDGQARFDMASLEALDATEIVTTTPWTEGEQTFVGVDLVKLMQAVGANGDTLIVTALNDYQVSVPISDFKDYRPILAYLRNGAPMPVSDKGPLFIVYPYDSASNLRNDVFYARSVWQVASFTVE